MYELEKDVVLKVIKIKDRLPKGYSYLSSWHCEYLLCNNFKVFDKLEKSFNVGYYKLLNPNKISRWLWLHRLDIGSNIGGDCRDLNDNDRVRGVLIWKKK